MGSIKENKRKFIRVQVHRLTSIVKNQGKYELLEETSKTDLALIDVKDISTGGLRIVSEYELMKGAFIDLTIPDIETLDSTTVKCEVIRSLFDDGNYTYDIGLRFIPPNTDYLKQLVELLKTY